jgi:hypothetical protein
MQERVESSRTEKFIEHKDIPKFMINTHSLHNAHLIRETLPRILTAPIPLVEDRKAKHFKIAASLRVSQGAKREAVAKKKEQAKESGNPGSSSTSKKRKVVLE